MCSDPASWQAACTATLAAIPEVTSPGRRGSRLHEAQLPALHDSICSGSRRTFHAAGGNRTLVWGIGRHIRPLRR
jgi:hypothetical protein